MTNRRLLFVTGTRADFGLMRSTLLILHDHLELDVSVIATGMHLSPEFGLTVQEIEADGHRRSIRTPS